MAIQCKSFFCIVCGFIAAVAQGEDVSSPAQKLDEIVVTAQKRTENLQDVPLSVSAVNSKQIEQHFAHDISDLSSISPNLIIDPLYGAAAASISIRGLQLDDGEKSFDPAVAVYLDGVYLASTTGALLNVFDADSVEVLRGPQGTLFGRNTIGGLIQVRRKEPTGEFGGKVDVTYGSYDQIDVKSVINLPAIFDDVVSTKFAIVSLNKGGYFRNVVRDTNEGNNDILMYSGAIKIQPNSNAKLVIDYDHIEDNSPTRPVTALTVPGQLLCPTAGAPGCGEPGTDYDYHLHPVTAIKQPQFSRTDSLIANGEVKLNSQNELVAVLGYRDIHEDSLEKFDGVEANDFYTVRPQISNQASAEGRYQGELGPVKIVAGIYYFHSFYHIQQQTFFFGGEVPAYETYQNEKTYAGFSQIDWNFADNFILTLGGRYSSEDKSMCAGSATGVGLTRVLLSAFGDCTASVEATPLYQPNAVNTVTGQSYRQDGKATFDSFTPKATLTYKFADDLVNGIAYATFSKGTRSGGFNGRASSAFSLGPYQPENVTNYELGLKTEWLDHRLQMNLTVFDLEYKNKQEPVVLPDPVEVTVTVVQNVAGARVRGIEEELKFLPLEGLTLGANFGYLNAKYSNYIEQGFNLDPASAAAQPFVTINKSNFELNRAPEFSADINGNYAHRADANGTIVLNVDYNWKDNYYIAENTVSYTSPNPGLVKAFGLLNASVSYQRPSWQISLFGKNLTNAHYFQHVLDAGTTYGGTPTNSTPIPIPGLFTYGTIAAPITWGVEGQYKF